MAIMILKGADFSADNIGQITLPREMNAFTKKIFSHCTKYSIYSEQAKLVDDFINYLDNEGLLEHLGLFMAPWLSKDVDEATYNIAGNTQLQYDEGVTLDNGILKSSINSKRVIIGNNVVPAVNFVGAICSGKAKSWTFIFSGEGNDNMTLLPVSDTSKSTISRKVSQNAGDGYGINVASFPGSATYLYNIKGLSDLDSNGTTVNGISVATTTGYSKANEPLSSPNGFSTLVGGLSAAETLYKQIFIAGDGTALTTEQVTSMQTAMLTLQAGLVALDE